MGSTMLEIDIDGTRLVTTGNEHGVSGGDGARRAVVPWGHRNYSVVRLIRNDTPHLHTTTRFSVC